MKEVNNKEKMVKIKLNLETSIPGAETIPLPPEEELKNMALDARDQILITHRVSNRRQKGEVVEVPLSLAEKLCSEVVELPVGSNSSIVLRLLTFESFYNPMNPDGAYFDATKNEFALRHNVTEKRVDTTVLKAAFKDPELDRREYLDFTPDLASEFLGYTTLGQITQRHDVYTFEKPVRIYRATLLK